MFIFIYIYVCLYLYIYIKNLLRCFSWFVPRFVSHYTTRTHTHTHTHIHLCFCDYLNASVQYILHYNITNVIALALWVFNVITEVMRCVRSHGPY